jgi:Concanavalin A-like lectin/glucanases superfamily
MLPLENLVRLMMARDFTGGASNSYLSTPAPVVGNTNFTVTCWMKYQSNNPGSQRRLIKLGTTNGLGLGWQTNNSNLQIIAEGVAWLGAQIPTATGVWILVGLSRAASGNVNFWKDGAIVSSASPSTSGPTGIFSCCGSNQGGFSPDAIVGDIACWNTELITEEHNILLKGVSPKMVRPGNLQVYWPLWGDSVEIDLSGKSRQSATTMGGNPPKADGTPGSSCPYFLAGVG